MTRASQPPGAPGVSTAGHRDRTAGARVTLPTGAGRHTGVDRARRLPENCHRSILSDSLCLRGAPVVHPIGRAARCAHALRAGARAAPGRTRCDAATGRCQDRPCSGAAT